MESTRKRRAQLTPFNGVRVELSYLLQAIGELVTICIRGEHHILVL
jgi:hypothetical protein